MVCVLNARFVTCNLFKKIYTWIFFCVKLGGPGLNLFLSISAWPTLQCCCADKKGRSAYTTLSSLEERWAKHVVQNNTSSRTCVIIRHLSPLDKWCDEMSKLLLSSISSLPLVCQSSTTGQPKMGNCLRSYVWRLIPLPWILLLTAITLALCPDFLTGADFYAHNRIEFNFQADAVYRKWLWRVCLCLGLCFSNVVSDLCVITLHCLILS